MSRPKLYRISASVEFGGDPFLSENGSEPRELDKRIRAVLAEWIKRLTPEDMRVSVERVNSDAKFHTFRERDLVWGAAGDIPLAEARTIVAKHELEDVE